ncbi:hypothetical protein TUM4636_22060 [Shewanella glacialipiscicola]|uniref:Transposase n=1 Tax=Shewanella glacialipiscicola TaxID=614069 RepID=A0ABQ6JAL9_9GAMM|nr:hypothetical protein TUM4636_22060 [Shewanella glacialipiscicola]GMA84421.1 hypothetical protein GCM10025855_39540 [Shewanella glacialipiscicola]GMA84513.1 hypothetical protein GCM10025855_40460 [Shewanella glacialipiscicola]
MSLKKSHKSYPQAFKDEAVLMVLEQGYSVADAAKSLGVSTSLLYRLEGKTPSPVTRYHLRRV